jgi:hypothetical protein
MVAETVAGESSEGRQDEEIYHVDNVTASYDLQANGSSISRCSVQMVQMDVTASYDLQANGSSTVQCADGADG